MHVLLPRNIANPCLCMEKEMANARSDVVTNSSTGTHRQRQRYGGTFSALSSITYLEMPLFKCVLIYSFIMQCCLCGLNCICKVERLCAGLPFGSSALPCLYVTITDTHILRTWGEKNTRNSNR